MATVRRARERSDLNRVSRVACRAGPRGSSERRVAPRPDPHYSNPMSPTRRRAPFPRLLALLACLLLLGLQQESLRHGVRHLGEQVVAHEAALVLPTVVCN